MKLKFDGEMLFLVNDDGSTADIMYSVPKETKSGVGGQLLKREDIVSAIDSAINPKQAEK